MLSPGEVEAPARCFTVAEHINAAYTLSQQLRTGLNLGWTLMQQENTTDSGELLAQFHARLSEAGLKSTRQRDAIFLTFFRLNKHISVDELLAVVREDAPHIGYATVYRTLKVLVEHGFAEPRQFDDGQTRFDPRADNEEEHDHLICVDCRRVIEFDDATVMARLGQIVTELGEFSLTRRKLELYARCEKAACEYRPKSTSGRGSE